MSDDRKQDRRGFLLSLGRCLVAGALTLGVGALAARPRETCASQLATRSLGGGGDVCTGCSLLEGCKLPQALDAKRDSAEQQKLTDCERRVG